MTTEHEEIRVHYLLLFGTVFSAPIYDTQIQRLEYTEI